MSIRALIVDDEEPARGELRYLLAAHPEVDVVGEAATPGEARALADSVRYDVVFLDIELPGMTGLEVARLVLDRNERPRSAIIVQHQVASTTAGVLFSRDPVNGRDEIVIEASLGLH